MKLLLERWKRFLKENEETETSSYDEMLQLDPWTFDQTKQGWRSLPNEDAQIKIIRDYFENPKSGKDKEIPAGKFLFYPVMKWHLGQVLAIRGNEGDKEEAIKWMEQSEDPQDRQWNNYVKATIAFLKGDREKFDEFSEGENYNSATLGRLRAGWGKTYAEAY